MLPVLIDLPFLKIYTFGVFLVLAFFWSSFLLWKTILLTSYREEDVFDGVFVSLFSGFLFSRLVFVATHFSDFGYDIAKFLLINGYPGLSLYGFIVGFVVGLFLFSLSKKFNFIEIADYFVPGALVALGFGKIGSFFAGTDIGSKTSFLISVKYVGFDGARHITALYESILFFIAAFAAYRILFAIRRNEYKKASNLAFFGFICSFTLFVFDFLKANKTPFLYGWSLNSVVSFILLLTSLILVVYYFKSLFINIFSLYGTVKRKNIHKSSEK